MAADLMIGGSSAQIVESLVFVSEYCGWEAMPIYMVWSMMDQMPELMTRQDEDKDWERIQGFWAAIAQEPELKDAVSALFLTAFSDSEIQVRIRLQLTPLGGV